MESELQKKVVALFNYSLNPGGIMILGTAETPGTQQEGFEEISSKLKIYMRSSKALETNLRDFPSSFYRRPMTEKKTVPRVVENIQTIADQVLLQHFAPASVLVNKQGDILYITGHTGKYLEPLAGKVNWNLYAMAREGLRHELPGAFRKAMKDFNPVILRNIKVGTNGGTQFVDVTVQRLQYPESVEGMFMVVFTDVPAVIEYAAGKIKTRKRSSTGREQEMEIELQRSHEEVESTREEMQTSQEELKSINEELQSTNEELQSTNEELTTSREEMQSLNEELQTLNYELQSKVGDFMRANDDMKNLLNSTEIATLFLDKDLNIRRFTDHVADIIKIRNTDIGRPFTELVTDLQYPEIGENARQVIITLISFQVAIVTNDGRWFEVRIMPYRTVDDRIDGLVITFTDITIAKRLEIELKKANAALRGIKKNR
jgi:two-component system CheB/CheR fusion protein